MSFSQITEFADPAWDNRPIPGSAIQNDCTGRSVAVVHDETPANAQLASTWRGNIGGCKSFHRGICVKFLR